MEDTSPYTPDSVFERQKENQNVFIPIGNEEAPVGNQDAFGNLGKSGNNQTPKGPLSVFIPRDYSEGELCQFSLNFPPALEGKIDPAILSDVVKNINLIMRDAETINKSHVLESIFGCLSCYLSYLFMTSYYQKVSFFLFFFFSFFLHYFVYFQKEI